MRIVIWTCFQVPNGGLVTNLFLIYWNHAVVPGTNLLTWSKGNQFFLVRNFNPENSGNASRILKSFFFRPEFNSHCESNFWANTETTNPNFHELFDQSKEVWQAFFVYLFLTMFFGQKQSDWSKHCENSGFVVLELVVGYWCLKMKRHYSIWFLLNRCVAVGVNIYVDAVINHMSGNDRTGNYIWIMNR